MDSLKEKLKKANYYLFYFIFKNFNKSKRISYFFIFLSKSSYHIFFLSYSLALIYSFINSSALGLSLIFKFLALPFLTLTTNELLRNKFKTKRPSETLQIAPLTPHSQSFCFPSNHSACSIVIAICIASLNWNLAVVFLPLAFLTGFSRIVTGVHYPFDVFIGWIIGFIFGIFI